MNFYVFCQIIVSIDIMRIGEQLAHHCLLALDSGYYRDLRRYLFKYIRSWDENTAVSYTHLTLPTILLV